jgi:hypothetical protein
MFGPCGDDQRDANHDVDDGSGFAVRPLKDDEALRENDAKGRDGPPRIASHAAQNCRSEEEGARDEPQETDRATSARRERNQSLPADLRQEREVPRLREA